MVRERVLRLKRWHPYRFLMETVRRFNEDQGAVLAGYIAYSSMLSAFPFLIFAFSLAGVTIGDEQSARAVNLLFEAVPEHVARTLQPVLREILQGDRPGIDHGFGHRHDLCRVERRLRGPGRAGPGL